MSWNQLSSVPSYHRAWEKLEMSVNTAVVVLCFQSDPEMHILTLNARSQLERHAQLRLLPKVCEFSLILVSPFISVMLPYK